jgi:cell migration-inducing and hyaluronan-binding protein
MRPAGGGGGFGGGFGAPRPPEVPIALVRNGKEHTITGNQSTVRSGSEIQVLTERDEFSLSVSEMDKDSWLLFELPGFANASDATEQSSMDALRKASETSYFRDGNSLWVKLIVPADPEPPIRPTLMQTSLTVSR